ncbi:hypothetical protein B5M42_015410 [Paenibacillus athensensis]|uniref:Uncharacterized protein n=1 Tax=Paenibacillus athensensis TaxID=1967502 RepID=A0A4Y8Q7U0_9BACL|nr:hypothetical protein [Paenibacillus athensensis]MCD1260199.1 hypothetical protein [Paenibacillus athensensis]
MNSGYLAFLLLGITLILFASGWKEVYVRSISHKGILLFFVGWAVCSRFSVPWHGIRVNLSAIWLTLAAFAILLMMEGFVQKLHLLSLGLLLGSFHFLLHQVLEMDPVFAVGKGGLDASLVLAVLTLLVQRQELAQIGCLTIGFLLGEGYETFMHHGVAVRVYGGSDFQDEWWVAVFAARTMTVVLQSLYAGCSSLLKDWLERRGGWRK